MLAAALANIGKLHCVAGYLFGIVGKVVGTVGGVVDQDVASRHNAEGPPEPVYRWVCGVASTWLTIKLHVPRLI